jgi:Tol biopolymer transport system component
VVRPVGAGSDLFRVPLTGGRGQRLTFAAARGCDVDHPSWRGSQVVYVRDCADTEQLRLLNLSTGHNRLVIAETTIPGSLSWPDFTPDLRIMFMSCGFDPATDPPFCASDNVTTINRDGTGLTVLTSFCGCGSEASGAYAVPSPDGSHFAVLERAPEDGQTESFIVVRDDAGNGNLAWTGPVSQSARAPDWQRLLT